MSQRDAKAGVTKEPVIGSLAHEITEAHQAAIGAGRTALEHARRAGELRLQAQAAVPHGAWLPWLAPGGRVTSWGPSAVDLRDALTRTAAKLALGVSELGGE